MYFFNSLDQKCRTPCGPVAEGTPIEFTLCADFSDGLWGAELFIVDDRTDKWVFFPMQKSSADGKDIFRHTYTPEKKGLFWYYFVAKKCGCDEVIGRDDDGNAKAAAGRVRPWQLSVYDRNYKTPDWIKGGVFYHIFVDRFCKVGETRCKDGALLHESWDEKPDWAPNAEGKILNNDFFGGNLKGITSKLGYLKKLGVTCLYLSPIFEAYSNHKYDTGDYMKIDPMFGDRKDFEKLCKKASMLGISVICDGVFNHVGADSVYFNRYGRYPSVGAYQSKDSPYYKWFSFVSWPNKYDCWWDFETLPDINGKNPDCFDFFCGDKGVIRKWLSCGAKGWRLDVVDELADSFVDGIRSAAKKENPDALIVGEVWEDASNKIAYGSRRRYFEGGQLDSVMNYPLKNAIIEYVRNGDGRQLYLTMRELCDNYPADVLNCLMNMLGTHDTARAITALAGDVLQNADRETKARTRMSERQWGLGVHRLKIASLIQFTLPGVPCVYYGDEAGTEGYNDPFNRTPFPWGRENGELLGWYSFLGGIRKNHPLFAKGGYKCLAHDGGVFAFERTENDDKIIVCVNLSESVFSLPLDGKYYDLYKKENYEGTLCVEPQFYYILKKV